MLSVFFMFTGKHKKAIPLFLIFATGGLSIFPNQVGPFKATHLTFFYLILFCIRYYKIIKIYIKRNQELKWLVRLVCFFFFSILVSILYFRFPLKESVTTGLRFLLFLSLLVYIPLKGKEYISVFRIVFFITLIASSLYIMQSIIGEQILPSSSELDREVKNSGSGGLYHYLNIPAFAIIFIPISIFCKQLIPQKLRIIAPVIFFSVLFVTLFRTHIISMILCILTIIIIKGKLKKSFAPMLLLLCMSMIFGGIFYERVTEKNDSTGDVSMVLAGRLDEADYQAKDGMTLLYRFAWIAERLDYMKDRPVELLFGLGMISDKKLQNKYYNFNFGLDDPDTGLKNQVATPDIAWGNMLTRFGLVGSIIVMTMYFSFMKKFWRYRKKSDLCLVLFAYLLSNLLASFSGATISDPLFWQPVFYLIAFANKRIELYNLSIQKNETIYSCNRLL